MPKNNSKTKPSKRPARPKHPPKASWWSGLSDDTRKVVRGTLVWTAVVLTAAGLSVWALRTMERQLLSAEADGGLVDSGQIRPADAPDAQAPVAFGYTMSYPTWMPARTANEIVATFDVAGMTFDDDNLADIVRRRAENNPWVARVMEVTRQLTEETGAGVVTVHCEFRRPVAKLMLSSDVSVIDRNTAYLDAGGVRLPAWQAAKYEAWVRPTAEAQARWMPFVWRENVPSGATVRTIHYPSIRGARGNAPTEGERWTDGDVAAGLRLVALLADRAYADQITVMDVRNYDGRISPNEPHLRMWAQVGQGRPTDIRFGRFPSSDEDYVVTPQRKVSYLDQYVQQNAGRLAGLHRYVDLRYDQGYASLR